MRVVACLASMALILSISACSKESATEYDSSSNVPTIGDWEWAKLTEVQYDELEKICLFNKHHETCRRLSEQRSFHNSIEELKRVTQ
jgi:hypothetical protein